MSYMFSGASLVLEMNTQKLTDNRFTNYKTNLKGDVIVLKVSYLPIDQKRFCNS